MNPRDVRSPKERLKGDICIIKEAYLFTFAVGNWDGNDCFLIRWNVTEKSEKGYPTSNKYPTWFVLPYEIGIGYVRTLDLEEDAKERISKMKGYSLK